MAQDDGVLARLRDLLPASRAALLDEFAGLDAELHEHPERSEDVVRRLLARPELFALAQGAMMLPELNSLISFDQNTTRDVTIGDVAGQTLIKYVLNFEGRPISKVLPHLGVPAIPAHSIARIDHILALTEALTSPNGKKLTILHGLSGTGKTILAAQVVQPFVRYASFHKHVFWGDLSTLTPADQLWSFMLELETDSVHRSTSESVPRLCDLFWREVGPQSALVVLDNVTDERQLAALLPGREDVLSACRILVISTLKLECEWTSVQNYHVGAFTPAEARHVFSAVLDPAYVQVYSKALDAIARGIEYFPNLVTAAALEFRESVISPAVYLQRLKDRQMMGGAVSQEGLQLALDRLDAAAQDLFPLIGSLGPADWSPAMLAATALQPPARVQVVVEQLANLGLLERTSLQRYRANSFVRATAAARLHARGAYAGDAAHTLLARYCFDLVQDLIARLSAISASGASHDVDFIKACRARILPEMAHLRHVLDWAVANRHWDLVRRFAHVSTLELVQELVVNRVDFELSAQLAALVRPLIRSRPNIPLLRINALIISNDLSYGTPPERDIRVPGPLVRPDGLTYAMGCPSEQMVVGELAADYADGEGEPARFNIALSLRAGHIIDGLISDVNVVEGEWLGVRAPGIILRRADLSGMRILGCDFDNAILLDLDARRASFTGSTLHATKIRAGTWRRANLQSVDLEGATIEDVDWRGVDLRGANLRDCSFHNVDLRGADLRDADASNCVLHACMLHAALLDGSRWTESPDETVYDEVARDQILRIVRRNGRAAETNKTQRPDPVHLSAINSWLALRMDLRAQDLRMQTLARRNLVGADLRAADLRDADLKYADLSGAVLIGTCLDRADLTSTRLAGACLRAAQMREAQFDYADLTGSDLSETDCRRATLTGAKLVNANLRYAILPGADLSNADCRRADFSFAELADYQLLSAASLAEAMLPCRSRVALFDRSYSGLALNQAFSLRFVHCTGEMFDIDWGKRDLFGARFTHVCRRLAFDGASLIHASLGGEFLSCTFSGADLRGALLHGVFVNANFTNANLTGANLTGARFRNANFHGASVEIDQLREADMLLGSTMPNGLPYAGDFDLREDTERLRSFAESRGLDLADPETKVLFYAPQKT